MMTRYLFNRWLEDEVRRVGGFAAASTAWGVEERIIVQVLHDPAYTPPRALLQALGVRRIVMYALQDEHV